MATAQLVSVGAFLVACVATAGLGRSLLLHLYGDQRRALARLRELDTAEGEAPPPRFFVPALSALPAVGALVAPGDRQMNERLKTRLTHAGACGPHAVGILPGARRPRRAGGGVAHPSARGGRRRPSRRQRDVTRLRTVAE